MLSAYKQHDFINYLMNHEACTSLISQKDRADITATLTDRKALLLSLPLGLSYIKVRQMLDMLRNRKAVGWRDPDFF